MDIILDMVDLHHNKDLHRALGSLTEDLLRL